MQRWPASPQLAKPAARHHRPQGQQRQGGWLRNEHQVGRIVPAAGGEGVDERSGLSVVAQHVVRVAAANVEVPIRPELQTQRARKPAARSR